MPAADPHEPIANDISGSTATLAAAAARSPAEPSPGRPPEGAAAGAVEAVAGGSVEAAVSIAEAIAGGPQPAAETAPVRDIGEASFGRPPSGFETVHGRDDRVRIEDPSGHPWRMNAALTITAANGTAWAGTGWFISPRTLITAGHCVFVKNSEVPGQDGWVRSITVAPGRNAADAPFGRLVSTDFRTVRGWSDDGDPEYDYGAIILPEPVGSDVGWLGFGVYTDDDLTESTVNVAGYPTDQPRGTLWYGHHQVARVRPNKVYYDIDTFGGQSGAAVYRIVDGQRYAIAVHTYGGATTNSGTRITAPVYENLQAWKA